MSNGARRIFDMLLTDAFKTLVERPCVLRRCVHAQVVASHQHLEPEAGERYYDWPQKYQYRSVPCEKIISWICETPH